MSPSSSHTAAAEPHVVEDCRGSIKLLSDGTIIRSEAPLFPVEARDDGSVEWKDKEYDPEHHLSVRLYKPRHLGIGNNSAHLPLVAYFHGGGFCLGSRTWPNFHAWCLRLAAELPAVVASFDYRLAPEHRLPAAIDDGAKALTWLRSEADTGTDPWLSNAVDFTRTFVSGDSAGGNISHHMAVKFGPCGLDPLVVRGYMLLMPAMIGEARTQSELACEPSAFLNMEQSDRYARLALPAGVTRDFAVVNVVGPEAPCLEAVEMAPVLVVAAQKDSLRDRNEEYVKKLKEWGKDAEFVEFAGQQHGFFEVDPWTEHADELVRIIKKFVVDKSESS